MGVVQECRAVANRGLEAFRNWVLADGAGSRRSAVGRAKGWTARAQRISTMSVGSGVGQDCNCRIAGCVASLDIGEGMHSARERVGRIGRERRTSVALRFASCSAASASLHIRVLRPQRIVLFSCGSRSTLQSHRKIDDRRPREPFDVTTDGQGARVERRPRHEEKRKG